MPKAFPLLVLLTLGCRAPELPRSTSTQQTVCPDAPPPDLPLGPNDVLQLVVPQRPEFSSAEGYRVSPAGSVLLPITGPVHVAGRSVEEARQAISVALAAYVRDPAVGLSVLEYASQRVYVLGEVARPGPVVLDRNLTALETLALAEGMKTGARRDRVALLRRHGPEEVEVYFFDAETPGLGGMVQVHPNDVLFVPRSGVGVFQEETLPVLLGIGFTTSQIATLLVIADQL